MNKYILQEMHQLSHEDDLRYRLLMIGVKQLLDKQKRGSSSLIGKIKYLKKQREIHAGEWD